MSEIRRDPAFSGAGERSEQIQGHPAQGEARLERLQDQLADLLYPSDGGEIDVDALDALLAEMEAVSPPPASLSTDPKESLEQFHRRYDSVLETADTGTDPGASSGSEKRHSRKPFAKVLALAAALLLLLSAMTAQAFGVNIFQALVRWTSEIFRLGSEPIPYAMVTEHPLEEGETATYDSLEEAVAAFGIDAPLVPKEIPEGFELMDVVASYRISGVLIYADYQSEAGYLQILYNEVETHDYNTLEKEDVSVDLYVEKGINHQVSSDLGRQKAIWQNGDLECSIVGDISEQELKAMIDSIYRE